MLILVINCGSSSVKYCLFDIASGRSLARGVVERIAQRGSSFSHEPYGKNRFVKTVSCGDHYKAISIVADALTSGAGRVIDSIDDISGIGHRVVHGGEEFKEATLLTEKVIRSIEKFSKLAPLHNPPSLSGIRSCKEIFKLLPQVAVFDTSFHQTMPEVAFLYGLPYRYYKKYGIRKYGFHGTSHRFVAGEAAGILRKNAKSLRLITCHLGNGCSMTAIRGGKSIDTSMGFTPLEGLLMGTRSGDIDPAAVLYIAEKDSLTPGQVNNILNKESGLLGVSGVSNDMRDILKNARGNSVTARRCRAAIEIFIYRIKKYIGAYQAAMGGLDAVVFTAGIGEHNPWIVKRVRKDLRKVISDKVKFLVIPTNEELLIARDTYKIMKLSGLKVCAGEIINGGR